MTALPYIALAATVTMWGTVPVVTRSLVLAAPPSDVLTIRLAIVSGLYLLVLAWLGNWRIERADQPRLFAASLLGMLAYNVGNTFGFALIEAAPGSLIIATQPLLIAVGASLVAGEPLRRAAMLGIAVAFAGTLLLFWGELADVEASRLSLAGAGLVLVSSLGWAAYVILAKPLIRTYGALPITALTSIICAIPLILNPLQGTLTTLSAMGAQQWAELLYLTIPCTFVATVLWNFGVGRLPAAGSGSFLYAVPLIGVTGGWLVLGESIEPRMIAGGVLILAGVALSQMRFRPPARATGEA